MHEDATPEVPAGRGRRSRGGLIALGVATGLMLAGFGVAAAQESPSTTTPGSAPAPSAEAKPERPFGRPAGKAMLKGGGFRHGFGGAGIHGEFTVPKRDGGYETIATQIGEVLKVSDSSIEVKSEDGYTRKYKVEEDTLVNAGRDGIGDVKTGDDVRISAVVGDGDAVAVQIADLTNLERIGEKRGFRGPR